MEFRASNTSKNSQVRTQNGVDVRSVHPDVDPQEASDDNTDRILSGKS